MFLQMQASSLLICIETLQETGNRFRGENLELFVGGHPTPAEMFVGLAGASPSSSQT